jgi:hypothetical protein
MLFSAVCSEASKYILFRCEITGAMHPVYL